MNSLHPNWFSEGIINVEYKRYVLLAYFQKVEAEHKLSKIWPALENLNSIINAMIGFRDKCYELSEEFPKSLEGLDHETGKLQFKPHV